MTDPVETPAAEPVAPPEYSYFRAEGLSLAAIGMMEEAKREDEKLRRDICKRFNAEDMMGGYDAQEDRFHFRGFLFHPPEQPVPEGWDILNAQSPTIVFAKPAPGTADDFNLAAMTGLLSRASRLTRLENVFKCGEMPMKSLPAGNYSAAFLQYRTLKDGAAPPKPDGTTASLRWMTYSNSPCRTSDPLASAKIGGDWYIRVPNVPGSDAPQMTPPDARRLDYDSMLRLEREERLAQISRAGGMGGMGRGH